MPPMPPPRCASRLLPLLATAVLSACARENFDRNGASDEAGYAAAHPYYAEFCALSQIKKKPGFGAEIRGEIGGHAVFYLNGACRMPGEGYPVLQVCDGVGGAPPDGVGMSMNEHFSNAKWVATPGRDWPAMARMVGFLNSQNAPYRRGDEVFRWSVFRDNCIHLAHNALAAAGLWDEWRTHRPLLLATFNSPVPKNEFVNLMRQTNDALPLRPDGLDPAAQRSLLQDGTLPTRPGALAEARPPQRPNAVYDTDLKLVFYDEPFAAEAQPAHRPLRDGHGDDRQRTGQPHEGAPPCRGCDQQRSRTRQLRGEEDAPRGGDGACIALHPGMEPRVQPPGQARHQRHPSPPQGAAEQRQRLNCPQHHGGAPGVEGQGSVATQCRNRPAG